MPDWKFDALGGDPFDRDVLRIVVDDLNFSLELAAAAIRPHVQLSLSPLTSVTVIDFFPKP